MRAFFPIMYKELKHIVRDRRSLVSALLLPLLLVLLFGYAINLDVTQVKIAVVDQDHSAGTRDIISHLTADGTVSIEAWPASAQELQGMLQKGQVKVGLVFPPGFGKDLESGRDAPVQILADGVEAAFAAQALGQISALFKAITIDRLEHGLRTAGRRAPLPSLYPSPRILYNESLDSRWFVVPGLISIIIMMLSALLTSQCVAREYERNTIEQILVSPVSGPALMFGKLVPYLLVGIAQVASVTLLSRFLFQVPIRGSLGLLAVCTLLYLVGAMSLGLLFSAALKSQQVALQVAFLATIIPSMILSGFIFPIKNMPLALQYLSYVVPARYYIEITRGLFLKGVGPEVLWPQILAMVVFATVVLGAAISRFRHSLS